MMNYEAMKERIDNYASMNRYEEIIENFIMDPLAKKYQTAKHIGIDTPKDQLDQTIKNMLDKHSVFSTNKNYLRDMDFLLIDDGGEAVMSIHGSEDVKISRCNVPFETDRDLETFTKIIMWLDEEIDSVVFLDDENIQLNYTTAS